MRKTKREVPFFVKVVVLFVLAIVHLGIQIWGNPDQRSSLNALEAPVKAPKISSPVTEVHHTSVKPEALPPGGATGPAPETLGKNPVESAADPAKASLEPTPAPVDSAPVTKPAELIKPVPAKPAGNTEVKVVKAAPLKPANKKKKPSISKEPERPEHVIPEEWNWFSKPLTMKIIGSELVITVEDTTMTPSSPDPTKAQTIENDKESESATKPAVVEKSEFEAKQPEKSEEKVPEESVQKVEPVVLKKPVKSVQDVTVPDISRSAPFERALAKMVARKSKREAEAARLSVKLPSSGEENRMVPGSLLKMIDALGKMRGSTHGQLQTAEDNASQTNGSPKDSTPMVDEGVKPADKDAASESDAR